MKQTFRDLSSIMGRLGEFRRLFIGSVLVIALHQIALVLVSVVSVWITTRLVSEEHPRLLLPFLALFCLAIAHALGYLYDAWWSHQLAYQILSRMRIDLYAAIQRIAPRGLSGRRTGDLTAAAMNDMEQLEWFYAHTAPVAVAALINTILIESVLIVLIGPLALLVLISVILPILVPWLLGPMQRRQGERVRAGLSSLKSLGLDSVVGARELYALGQREEHRRRVLEASAEVQRNKLAQAMRKSLETAVSAFGAAAVSIGILAVLTRRVIEGAYPAEQLPVAVILVAMATLPVLSLAGMLGIMGEVSSCAHRINEVLDAPDPIPGAPLELPLVEGEEEAAVSDSATYRYEGEAAVKEASLRVPGGRSVALIGPSGAGKSTFAHLLMRFMDPDSGSIRFSGRDLRSLDPDEHRLDVALVPQNGHVFSGSFRSNLLLADWDADDDRMWEALRAAGLQDLVEGLGGLDAPVGDRGTALSGGERQRLVLARAFLRQPRLLILDEPSANLDPELEREITESATRLRRGRTTLVISHRLASLIDAESIWVLDSGRVVAHGSHEELERDSADYRRILADQSVRE
ncbi:MAG: ABC transporter ATP-binding protein [Schaalia hyovaginalis]|uniref:ABC transporter ATP-binding protein n=1 Tax=Schaalia hyovaginalis TaxID=29316 RepID=UPI0026ED1C5C|nr:ABC transporter ATP-binding protein [Schaalia hyovaginalis]MCI6410625.1 ABC transporter ATP-binding protein/permease [Schaalia hyovaginalis]MCI7513792.1 ABC transporter ATP-binding protein/permease [Schaalia hyovaginalis]MDY4262959.1 ABC transporter ATP-binding protein [Schaalia hyovaginalis]MDY6212915.1 ABC transporter ATP-binding protein [Schaalia hyovaginalis]